MDHARLAQANLNLLVTLDVLLETRSVTRAAERLGVTVSAVSHGLRALRESFDDPLFVRTRAGLEPTPRALGLAGPLRQGLRTLDQTLEDDPRFHPASSARTFTLATTDYVAAILAGPLMQALAQAAPGVTLDIRSVPESEVEGQLARSEVDVAIGIPAPAMEGLVCRRLLDDGFACLVREGHPRVGKRLTLATYVDLQHALISPQGTGGSVVDRLLAERGLARHVALRVQSFVTAPFVVAESDLVLTAPTLLVRTFARHAGLRVLTPPLSIPRFSVYLFWHPRVERDPAHAWLRARLSDAAPPSGRRR
jgi:DNA-binding transcriptional LysR family regulator